MPTGRGGIDVEFHDVVMLLLLRRRGGGPGGPFAEVRDFDVGFPLRVAIVDVDLDRGVAIGRGR